MAPLHPLGGDPTLAIDRDLSAGWETVASPDMFMATGCRPWAPCGAILPHPALPV